MARNHVKKIGWSLKGSSWVKIPHEPCKHPRVFRLWDIWFFHEHHGFLQLRCILHNGSRMWEFPFDIRYLQKSSSWPQWDWVPWYIRASRSIDGWSTAKNSVATLKWTSPKTEASNDSCRIGTPPQFGDTFWPPRIALQYDVASSALGANCEWVSIWKNRKDKH